jgi:hypothetical protein
MELARGSSKAIDWDTVAAKCDDRAITQESGVQAYWMSAQDAKERALC